MLSCSCLKDFLEEECVTPDCGAPLVQIQIFGSKGLKTEVDNYYVISINMF